MSAESGGNRWWENYLVRYFMPSIAGIVIVLWLGSINCSVQKFLLLPTKISDIENAPLLLLFLYGNIYCYISSYPILVFHATRALDFKLGFGGYSETGILGICVGSVLLLRLEHRECFAYIFVSLFTIVQLFYLCLALKPNNRVIYLKNTQNRMLSYVYNLAKKRGDDVGWKKEFVETYRHLREHGNSAFILVLELILAGLLFCIVPSEGEKPAIDQLSSVGILLFIWVTPAVVVHLAAQRLERDFSQP